MSHQWMKQSITNYSNNFSFSTRQNLREQYTQCDWKNTFLFEFECPKWDRPFSSCTSSSYFMKSILKIKCLRVWQHTDRSIQTQPCSLCVCALSFSPAVLATSQHLRSQRVTCLPPSSRCQGHVFFKVTRKKAAYPSGLFTPVCGVCHTYCECSNHNNNSYFLISNGI